MRGGRLILLLGLAVAAVAGAVVPATAATLPQPGGFRTQASNGYVIHAIAFDGDPRGEHDEVLLFVTRKGGGVTYFAQKGVQVTETTVTADLGDLGSIDLHYVPSGKPRVERSACDPRPIEVDSGFYEGRFDFEGEEGYTQAHRSRVRGEVRLQLSLLCGGAVNEGIGGHAPGARLHWRRGKVEFEVTKNSPSRPARFRAAIQEKHAGLAIAREVGVTAGAGAFGFDVPAQTATLKPPAPFSGSARFLRGDESKGHLEGSLAVDFPGRSNVPLSGGRGSLQRWVENPSHPFRPAAWLIKAA